MGSAKYPLHSFCSAHLPNSRVNEKLMFRCFRVQKSLNSECQYFKQHVITFKHKRMVRGEVRFVAPYPIIGQKTSLRKRASILFCAFFPFKDKSCLRRTAMRATLFYCFWTWCDSQGWPLEMVSTQTGASGDSFSSGTNKDVCGKCFVTYWFQKMMNSRCAI